MRLIGIEARLISDFQSTARSKVMLDEVQNAFSRTCPELNNEPSRRARLAEALEKIAGEGLILLPVNRKKDWQNFLTPPLPNWIRVIREKTRSAARFEHAKFPWVPEMRFVASLSTLPAASEARQLHDFFKNGGSQRPIVPTKERSWQIFGHEKRLEELIAGKYFFGPNRLTLQMLRCRPVSYSLVYRPSPQPCNQPAIILENEATFHSFARLNAAKSIYAAVIFGNGQAVLKGVEFLTSLARSLNQKDFFYFGDLDSSGIRIATELSKQLAAFDIRILPETSFYRELISTTNRTICEPEQVSPTHLSWLTPRLAGLAQEKLTRCGRVAQEALGWECLCNLFSVDPMTDFYEGF
jgi:hypothetical protein